MKPELSRLPSKMASVYAHRPVLHSGTNGLGNKYGFAGKIDYGLRASFT